MKFTFFSVIFVLFCTVSLKSQTNLIRNGGFEETGENGLPDQWTFESNTFAIETSVVKSGANSLDANTTGGYTQIIQDNIPVGANKIYTLSFQYYVYRNPTSPTTSGIHVERAWERANGSQAGATGVYDFLTCYDTWLPYEETMTSHNAAAAVKIFIIFDGGIGVYIDDVKLVEQSTTGIHSVEEQPLLVRVENGNVIVRNAAEGSYIEAYNIFGERLQSVIAATGETVLSGLPKGQVLIVRNGNEAAKVAL
jgi:hypothetical protein